MVTTEDKTEIPSVLNGINPLRIRFIPYNARLVDARKAKGLTQFQLGMLTGIRLTELSHIETLRLQPTEEQKSELAGALEADATYLFPESLLDVVRSGVIPKKRLTEFGSENLLRLVESRQRLMLEGGREQETEMRRKAEMDLLSPEMTRAIASLKPREQEVLRLRFGLGGATPHTLKEVGREFGVLAERIRQIEAKALRKLRHPARSRMLKDYLD